MTEKENGKDEKRNEVCQESTRHYINSSHWSQHLHSFLFKYQTFQAAPTATHSNIESMVTRKEQKYLGSGGPGVKIYPCYI